MVYSTDRSKVVVPVLGLLFVDLWFILRGDLFVLCLTLCYFVLVFFSPFSIAITSLGEERANISAFRTLVRFALVWFLSVSSSSWCLGRAAVCDCGTPWTFLLPFFFFFFFFLQLYKIDQAFLLTPNNIWSAYPSHKAFIKR